MPKVLANNGFDFYFYSDEGTEPVHVHIKKAEGRAKWWLEPAIEEEYAYGFTLQERRKIKRLIIQNQDYLKEKWYEYFQR